MKKGFTLVELLAVIIIMSLLITVVSLSIVKTVKNSKEELYQVQITAIKDAAIAWGIIDNIGLLPNAGSCKYITLGYLKNKGLIDFNLVNPKNNELINNDMKIKITTTFKMGKNITSYEVNPESVDGCESIEKACTVITGTGTNIGDIIKCKSEMFYVLSADDTNIKMLTKYNLNVGPDKLLTAPEGLQNENAKGWYYEGISPFVGTVAFSDSYGWGLGENINIESYDGQVKTAINNYKTMLEEFGINVNSIGLITQSELVSYGCSVESRTCTSSPYPWLYSTGYWVGTAKDDTRVWLVFTAGAFYYELYSLIDNLGVRPIVTIPKTEI